MIERNPQKLFGRVQAAFEHGQDGTLRLWCKEPLGPVSRCVGDWLVRWSRDAPKREFLRARGRDSQWSGVSYAEAHRLVRRMAAWLLKRDLSAERPLAILSDNSIESGLLSLAALHIGVPIVPISPAYSLVSVDFNKLRTIVGATTPGLVYAADGVKYSRALKAIRPEYAGDVVVAYNPDQTQQRISFGALLEAPDSAAVDAAFAGIGPDTIAKLLFTSGSTGQPKGVVNTQRMLCVNQQQISQVWPFIHETPPVVVDWLPWNHTFGGNHNFNLVLRAGGTMHIDEGRPTPGLFERTVANLREVPPTVYFNVPRGYDMLIPHLRQDEALRRRFFSRLQVIFYAAAALPQHLWDGLDELARATIGASIPLVSAWGSTETAPLATSNHSCINRAGMIGLPVPGTELKLVPRGANWEIRVRGPQVTPGYWREPLLSEGSFDDEGFYCMGDAVRLVEESHPEAGLYFDGRVSEDFKLSSGTWVNTGALRIKALGALATLVQDIVVAGHDRSNIGFLLFLNLGECAKVCGMDVRDLSMAQAALHPDVRERIARGLAALRQHATGSSTFAARALILLEPPAIDAGEITDKGYINQRAVLTRRAELVERLFDARPRIDIIVPSEP